MADRDDVELRKVLQELSSGRLLVDEALAEVNRLRPLPTLQAAGPIVKSRKSSGGGIVAGLILLVIGGIFGGVGGAFAFKTLRFETSGQRVEGTVVRMVHGGGKNKGSKPVVSFVVGGKTYEVTGTISASPPAYSQGEKVTVYYNADDPNDAQIGGFVERWLFPVIFGGIGGVVALVGLILLFVGVVRKLFKPFDPQNLESARFSPE